MSAEYSRGYRAGLQAGHGLHREIVAKYGVDRYPTAELCALKLVEELGELVKEILRTEPAENLAKEYGDVGLTLYGLGNYLGLSLADAMHDVVSNEERKFA